MCRSDHPGRIKPACLQLREQLLVKRFVDLRRTTQNPEVLS